MPAVTPVLPRKVKSGRGDWIRTSDPLRPRQVRYQAALRPDPTGRPHYPTGRRPRPCRLIASAGPEFRPKHRPSTCEIDVAPAQHIRAARKARADRSVATRHLSARSLAVETCSPPTVTFFNPVEHRARTSRPWRAARLIP